jgi:hypothetical protein
LPQDSLYSGCFVIRLEILLYPLASSTPHASAQRGLLEQTLAPRYKGFQIAHPAEVAGDPVFYELGDAVGVGCHHWESTGHGFKNAIGHAFLVGGVEVDIQTLQRLDHLLMQQRTGYLDPPVQIVAVEKVGYLLVDGGIQAIAGYQDAYLRQRA